MNSYKIIYNVIHDIRHSDTDLMKTRPAARGADEAGKRERGGKFGQ